MVARLFGAMRKQSEMDLNEPSAASHMRCDHWKKRAASSRRPRKCWTRCGGRTCRSEP
jgi:hypothetical protein